MFLVDAFLYVPHLVAALWSVLTYLFNAFVLRRPVSYPGDPLKRPVTRRGQWPSDRAPLPVSAGDWKFASDAASHAISQKVAPKHPMTGESAGRQIWYQEPGRRPSVAEPPIFDPSENPNSGDQLFRSIMLSQWQGPMPSPVQPKTAGAAAHKALQFYQMLQCEDGHWAGDYGGPMFLMPGLVCSIYITKAPFPAYKKQGMITYLRNHQQVDGGWGTHIECASTMFGTVLSYVALRLLGAAPHEDYMVSARRFIHDHGGALYAPSWVSSTTPPPPLLLHPPTPLTTIPTLTS